VNLGGILADIVGGRYQFNTENSTPLQFLEIISDLWPQPPSNNRHELQLHIYISRPELVPAGEYSCLVTLAQDI